MTAKPSKIERLRIATPCPISWEQMAGDDRVRFCDHCNLNVYNISELTRIEAETLIASTEGRLCARLFQRADGTILTRDCPVGLRALRRRVAKRTAAIFAAIVSLSAFALGQGSAKNGKTSCTPQTKITRTDATSDAHEKALSGTVLDPMGAVVPGAKVKLMNADAKELRQTSTNDDGRFEFGPIEPGNYSVAIEQANFKTLKVRNVIVEKDKLTNVEVILQAAVQWETVGILVAEPSLIEIPPGTIIINKEMIQRLPHQK